MPILHQVLQSESNPGLEVWLVSNVRVSGCWFGLNDAGTAGGTANQNIIDIGINNSTNNQIGGTTASDRNVICTAITGILLATNADSNVVEGNLIGMRPDGTTIGANAFGVRIMGSANNVIGGTTAASRNIISGNGDGVRVFNVAAPGGNQIADNYIGVDPTGLIMRSNDFGINMENAVGTIIRQNVISANNQYGIRMAVASGRPRAPRRSPPGAGARSGPPRCRRAPVPCPATGRHARRRR